ncbi:putative uncharacterized protein MYH16 isoform X2 [Heptranchias perlo]|uniref:putative uncharacterized protein MYH16 isoform X2 n=1 Tax=Heptranchias perlo TaxID=212740 RepID=UPI00355A1C71
MTGRTEQTEVIEKLNSTVSTFHRQVEQNRQKLSRSSIAQFQLSTGEKLIIMEAKECDAVVPIKSALRSITKASDVRNDNALLLQPYSNWEQFLMPGPLSVAILGEIIFLSAGEDFAIDKNMPKNGFQYIKYPKSFRASLVQVSNQGWEAFQEAHKNMDQIRLHALTVPNDMKDVVKFIMQKDPEITKDFLPIPLGSIKSSADKCLQLTTAVEKKFMSTIDLIHELLEACTSSQGAYEEELHQIKIKKEINEMKQKSAKLAKENAEKHHKKMEQQIEKAQAEYKASMDSVPVGWNAVAMKLTETFVGAVSSFISGGILKTLITSTSNAYNRTLDYMSNKNSKSCNVIYRSDFLQYLTSMFLSFLDKDGDIDVKKLKNEKNRTAITNLCKENLERFQHETENEEDCKEKEDSVEICKAAIEICEKLETLAQSNRTDAKAMANLAAKIKEVQQKSTKFGCHCKASTGSMGVTSTPPHMSKAQPEEAGSGLKSASDNARFKVEQSAAQLRASEELYDRSFENMKKNNKELEEILENIRKCNVQEIDFNKTVEMLMKGLDALGRVKEQWGKMVLFFTMMSNLIDSCLNTSLNKFIQYSEKASVPSSYSHNQFVQDVLYTQISHATNIASLVHMISETYVQVSTHHLMDRVNSLGKLMGLNPTRDKVKFEIEHNKFGEDCSEASKAIENLVMKNKEDYEKRVHERIKRINESVGALLLPATEEEIKELQDTVQKSTRAAIVELTEEEMDQFS